MTDLICKTSFQGNCRRKASGQNIEETWRERRERGETAVVDQCCLCYLCVECYQKGLKTTSDKSFNSQSVLSLFNVGCVLAFIHIVTLFAVLLPRSTCMLFEFCCVEQQGRVSSRALTIQSRFFRSRFNSISIWFNIDPIRINTDSILMIMAWQKYPSTLWYVDMIW